MTEEILSRLEKIEHQLKFFADAYKTLHNILINGIHVKLEKELLEPSLSRITDKVYEFKQLQIEMINLIKNDTITGSISFMGKRMYEVETLLKEIKETGIKKKLHIDFTVDGYEMVKKKPLVKDDDPQEEINPEQAVRSLLETLTERDAEVIKHRYGLLGEQKKTLAKLAKIMSISSERLRQIQNRALRKMRHTCRRKFVSVLTHKELKYDILGE